jgi:hypothetical protein
MNAVAPRRNPTKALEVIAKFVSADPAEQPMEFVRELVRFWKERGGLLAGKPRHSDRYLDELVRANGMVIRSLTPKLGGRTNLRRSDAAILVPLLLMHWTYKGDPYSGEITVPSSKLYEPLLSDAEIREVSAYVADALAEQAAPTVIGTSLTAAQPLVGQDTIDLIANEFEKADALFTAAIGSPFVLPRPEEALVGFRKLMDTLWAIERTDGHGRILVWTMDLGRQVFEDSESRRRFMHVQELVTRFKALEQFRDDETLNWLRSRAIIVLHDVRSGQRNAARRPAFDPHHVLFSAIPPRWAASSEFNELYGKKPEQANYSIFLRSAEQLDKTGISPEQTSIAAQSYTLRYFGHAVKPGDDGKPAMRGLELPAPGHSYEEALGTVFIAARQVLGLSDLPTELMIDGTRIVRAHAIEKLDHHGLRLLSLDDFIRF